MTRSSKINRVTNPAITNNKTKKRSPDFLSHIVFGNKATDILKILKDGFLRSSKETKNVKLFGWAEGSEFIYLQLNNNGSNLHLDINALEPVVNPAYFNYGWCGGMCVRLQPASSKTPEHKDRSVSEPFSLKQLAKYKSWIAGINKSANSLDLLHSHEIIATKPIDLTKYLKTVKLGRHSGTPAQIKQIERVLSAKYPGTELILLDEQTKK